MRLLLLVSQRYEQNIAVYCNADILSGTQVIDVKTLRMKEENTFVTTIITLKALHVLKYGEAPIYAPRSSTALT